MPYLDQIYFGNSKKVKGILNIGGISNITFVGKSISPIAFDIGPGNALIDLVAQNKFKKEFDRNGAFASKGKVNDRTIEKALKDPYFKRKPPKSSGKEYFNNDFIKKYFSTIKNKNDLIATVTFFTAKTIEESIKKFAPAKMSELVISGGGINNKTLISFLQSLLPEVHINPSDKYALPSKYKEAILFGLLGYTCHKGIPNNIPSCTGAKRKVILGKISRAN